MKRRARLSLVADYGLQVSRYVLGRLFARQELSVVTGSRSCLSMKFRSQDQEKKLPQTVGLVAISSSMAVAESNLGSLVDHVCCPDANTVAYMLRHRLPT
jgi:hypothetical protein